MKHRFRPAILIFAVVFVSLASTLAIQACRGTMENQGQNKKQEAPPVHKSLETHIEEVTGPSAVDCGRLYLLETTAEEMEKRLACVENAIKQKQAFRFILTVRWPDSGPANGLMGDEWGNKFLFFYDSGPCQSFES